MATSLVYRWHYVTTDECETYVLYVMGNICELFYKTWWTLLFLVIYEYESIFILAFFLWLINMKEFNTCFSLWLTNEKEMKSL